MAAARIGPLRLSKRRPEQLWRCPEDIAVIASGDLAI